MVVAAVVDVVEAIVVEVVVAVVATVVVETVVGGGSPLPRETAAQMAIAKAAITPSPRPARAFNSRVPRARITPYAQSVRFCRAL